MLSQQTQNKLQQLKLSGMAKAYRDQLDQPRMQELSFDDRFGLMVDRELSDRESRKLSRLLKQAKLRYAAYLEDLDYRSTRGLDKQVIAGLAGCSWIHKQHNVLITGASGTGKSWLACALGSQACRQGYSAIYKSATQLYEELQIAIGDGSLPKYRAALSKVHLLILDDFGLAPVEPAIGYTLLDLVDQRMQTGSLIITSQFPTEHWHSMFSDATLADAILDRIVHRSHRIGLKGESLRRLAGTT
jgi:DNA replication protein DnaC